MHLVHFKWICQLAGHLELTCPKEVDDHSNKKCDCDPGSGIDSLIPKPDENGGS